MKMMRRVSEADLPNRHRYAEAWLEEAVELFRPRFSMAGFVIPKTFVSVGFSSNGVKKRGKVVLGECLSRSWSASGDINYISISPYVSGSSQALFVLEHELIHAVDDCQHMHGKEFQEIATAIKSIEGPGVMLKDISEKMKFEEGMRLQLGQYPVRLLRH